jgi:hypothetical protein
LTRRERARRRGALPAYCGLDDPRCNIDPVAASLDANLDLAVDERDMGAANRVLQEMTALEQVRRKALSSSRSQ